MRARNCASVGVWQGAPGGLHAAAVRAPMRQASAAEALEQLQPLAGADVPVPLLLRSQMHRQQCRSSC